MNRLTTEEKHRRALECYAKVAEDMINFFLNGWDEVKDQDSTLWYENKDGTENDKPLVSAVITALAYVAVEHIEHLATKIDSIDASSRSIRMAMDQALEEVITVKQKEKENNNERQGSMDSLHDQQLSMNERLGY